LKRSLTRLGPIGSSGTIAVSLRRHSGGVLLGCLTPGACCLLGETTPKLSAISCPGVVLEGLRRFQAQILPGCGLLALVFLNVLRLLNVRKIDLASVLSSLELPFGRGLFERGGCARFPRVAEGTLQKRVQILFREEI